MFNEFNHNDDYCNISLLYANILRKHTISLYKSLKDRRMDITTFQNRESS